MSNPLPSNDSIVAYGNAVDWLQIEQQKRRFNSQLSALKQGSTDDELPLDALSQATGVPITTLFDHSDQGNVLLGQFNGTQYVLASVVSKRYRYGKTLLQSLVPYNLNPSVNHTNLHESNTPVTALRALGAELELGLYHPDGTMPSEAEVQRYSDIYRRQARMLGITPTVDREACMYQIEVHVAPGIGYNRTRASLEGILKSLVAASNETGLYTAILSAFPLQSDFALTDHPKVHTAVDVMQEINSQFPVYQQRMAAARQRYHMESDANVVQIFRLQGCHIHLDIAGRSEALGLMTFYTMLRSATAIANAALLKGGPFVNGTCDPDLTCTREYLRQTTITGSYFDLPISPHLSATGLDDYASLLQSERANSPARALLGSWSGDELISAMHNPLGRLRPDLGMSKRICTVESTGMCVNISASRQAAVLSDFEFTHALVEKYYRQYGTDLQAMMDDEALLNIIGPLSIEKYDTLQDLSDRQGIDFTLETATGAKMSLPEFYEMKRRYLHKTLIDVPNIDVRDIDDVYMSILRMIAPPSGRVATTPEEYIIDPTRRSTGNWGQILRDAFLEEGGTPGDHAPEIVLRVSNRIHEALVTRYSHD